MECCVCWGVSKNGAWQQGSDIFTLLKTVTGGHIFEDNWPSHC